MRIKKGTSMMQRKAGEVKRYRQEKKIIPIAMGCIALLTVIVYVVSLLYTRFGSFTVSVNKYQQLNYGLSLSETKDFSKPTPSLNCKSNANVTNIDGKKLDDVDLGAIDGEANGKDYLCYTFYCKNTGNEVLDYEYSINIINMTMDIEKAVRIRVITSLNGSEKQQIDYARAKGVDDKGEAIPEESPYGTTPFYQNRIVCLEKVKDFNPADVMKYTIVLWLEGPDEDCVDDIIGGSFKIDMKFSVTSHSGIDTDN